MKSKSKRTHTVGWDLPPKRNPWHLQYQETAETIHSLCQQYWAGREAYSTTGYHWSRSQASMLLDLEANGIFNNVKTSKQTTSNIQKCSKIAATLHLCQKPFEITDHQGSLEFNSYPITTKQPRWAFNGTDVLFSSLPLIQKAGISKGIALQLFPTAPPPPHSSSPHCF